MPTQWVAPPGWPTPPEGFAPPFGWRPDSSWPPPRGWQFWQRPPLSRPVLLLSILTMAGATMSLVAPWLNWYAVTASFGGGHRVVLQHIRGVSYLPIGPHAGPGVASAGLLTVFLAAVMFVAAALHVGTRSSTRVAASVAVAVGGLAAALLVWTVVDLEGGRPYDIRDQATHNLWLALAGACIVVVSGLCQLVVASRPR